MLLDRMINLLTRGCVVPVVKYIKQCSQKGDTDTSLIRYFVTEVNVLHEFFFSSKLHCQTVTFYFAIFLGSRNHHTSLFTRIRTTVSSNGRK